MKGMQYVWRGYRVSVKTDRSQMMNIAVLSYEMDYRRPLKFGYIHIQYVLRRF